MLQLNFISSKAKILPFSPSNKMLEKSMEMTFHLNSLFRVMDFFSPKLGLNRSSLNLDEYKKVLCRIDIARI